MVTSITPVNVHSPRSIVWINFVDDTSNRVDLGVFYFNGAHAKHVRNGVETLRVPTFGQNQEILQSTLTTFACAPSMRAEWLWGKTCKKPALS